MSPLNQTWHNENRHEKNSFCWTSCCLSYVCIKDKDFTTWFVTIFIDLSKLWEYYFGVLEFYIVLHDLQLWINSW